MSKHIATESFTEQLFLFFEETFERVHGLYLDRGTSLFETLDSLTAEEASRRLSANSGSIAAKVEHVRFFLQVCDDSMRLNKVEKVNWDESWRKQEVTPEEWAQLKNELRVAYERVLTLMKSIDVWKGEDEISDSLSILIHTAYHLGEIRQALAHL
jgi:hypothetical protein